MTSSLFQTYNRSPLTFIEGQGAWLISIDGERYLDFAAGIAVNSLGHCHPRLVAALKEQADKLWHVSNLYRIDTGETLAERLVAHSFANHVFFTNSGAEAMECAIKTARRYHFVNDEPNRFRCLTFEGAFHGRTLATIAAGGQKKYLEGFGPKVDGFDQLPSTDPDVVRAAINAETAAIIVEPIQGEGGIRAIPHAHLRAMRTLCDEHGLLLIFDEIQCGMGRTGKLFAYEWSAVQPDIMALAKGLGGGFPMGACLATKEAAKGMTFGMHGSTFGGNPMAMAVGNVVMDIMLEPTFLENINTCALYFKQRLAALVDQYSDYLEDIRGEGLMLGLRCKIPASDLVTAAFKHNLLVVGAGDNVVRLLPPLTVETADIDTAIKRLDAALANLPKTEGNTP